ncbi:hypothetical protein [Actibacterium pelagium]|uniref:Uncharacterized protein n=1 Tax=Actibacterium pelagium TaxID=2029103 RepID=A0A917AFH4_9RHOB|nr:hypothetical protein [Actibacterium pelagium]GGE46702.1 hypothetical protein GCM10011517_13040 [Actibacterium pelagium]
MALQSKTLALATLLTLVCHQAVSAATVCIYDSTLGRTTYSVDGDKGAYTWEDHGIARTWALNCTTQPDDTSVCHRWVEHAERGRSVMIFQMLPEGVLIEASSWALLDHSTVTLTPGFTCSAEGK